MTSPAYQHILDLQDIDVEILQLNHQFANHRLRTELSDLIGASKEAHAELAAVQVNLDDNQASQRQVQHRVAELETKRQSSESKLYGGAVTASNELLTLTDEVKGFQAKQDDLEGDLLELMEQSDSLKAALASSQGAVESSEKFVEEAETALAAALAQLNEEIAAKQIERNEKAATADADLLVQYDKLAPQYDGAPVARLADGCCDGCHIQLSVVALDKLVRLPESTLLNCEECGRLLVR